MKKIPTFALGLIVGIALTAGTAVGAVTYLKATPKTVKLVVDSKQTSVSAMNVNNKLYVPIRDAGNSFGYQVTEVTSSTVTFQEGTVTTSSVGSETKSIGTTTSNKGVGYVQGLHTKYSTDGKLDANKVKAGIAANEITVNSQDNDGNSLLHHVILEDNFAVYSLIKVNALNPNLQNKEGRTPLHVAVIEDNDFYFGELTSTYKSDATIRDSSNKRAIDYAKKGTSTYNGLQAYMM